jgi:hypothetical protein
MLNRTAAVAAAVITAAVILGPLPAWLVATAGAAWLIGHARRADPDDTPPPSGTGAEAIKALERIATKAIQPKKGRAAQALNEESPGPSARGSSVPNCRTEP